MATFVDSHAHFSAEEGADGFPAVIERAVQAGVTGIVAVGGSRDTEPFAVAAARRYPDIVGAVVGYDRDSAGVDGPGAEEIRMLREEVSRLKGEGVGIVGIGETGLDFHYSPDTAEQQILLFERQLQLAGELSLPVVVHSRDAERETAAALRAHAESGGGQAGRIGVVHCFTGSASFAEEVVALGYHIGFSGIVTFKNAGELRDVAKSVPEDRLLIETDSPYLAPEPYRGKRNEPAFVVRVAEVLAEVRGCSADELGALTAANAWALLGLAAV